MIRESFVNSGSFFEKEEWNLQKFAFFPRKKGLCP
jgi:hypothetical protein